MEDIASQPVSANTTMQNEPLEVVLETIDPTEVAIVKSLLEGAGIPYLTRGEDQYDAFRGAFRGTVFSSHGRPVAFLVPASMAKEARLLLQEGSCLTKGCEESRGSAGPRVVEIRADPGRRRLSRPVRLDSGEAINGLTPQS